MGYREQFEYSGEWYGDSYVEDWLPAINSSEDLLKNYHRQANYFQRTQEWFTDVPIKGDVLELGHNDGKTIWWLSNNTPAITNIDCIDFNESLKKLEGPLRELIPTIRDVWYADCRNIKKPDNSYDCITSLDFYEHLPNDIYQDSISECFRLLKEGGLICVYLGKGTGIHHPEHINVIPDEKVIGDMCAKGFTYAGSRGRDKMLLFTK